MGESVMYHKLWHNARLLALINTTDHSSTNKSIEVVVMVVVTVVGLGGSNSWRDPP